MQVSEDHCWINYCPEGSREGSIEVTTDSAAKRGKVVDEAAWQGWLYTGGEAVLCSPKATNFPFQLLLLGNMLSREGETVCMYPLLLAGCNVCPISS